MKRTPLRRISEKRKAELKAYSTARRLYLQEHPFCEVELAETGQQIAATDIHHKEKRGKNLIKIDTWLAVCRHRHQQIHDNPSWARQKGYLK